jgi:hypothetical protein
VCSKSKVLEVQLQQETYTPDTLPALRRVAELLDQEEAGLAAALEQVGGRSNVSHYSWWGVRVCSRRERGAWRQHWSRWVGCEGVQQEGEVRLGVMITITTT